MPRFLASFTTPSFNETKNGLFNVETESPIVNSFLCFVFDGFAHCGGSSEQADSKNSDNAAIVMMAFFILHSPTMPIFVIQQHRD